ncbi:MAG TPA: SDR family NAD(P)-dependent oxidoreductase [Acidimicrobiales bacterium]|nr:SDR family NAD(P)-dependent oxidoreductase [Acidimicrobiales bacterium]
MPVAIVTGASMGLGRAVAHALADEGWGLVIDARHDGPLADTAGELASRGATVRALPGDIADGAHRQDLIDAATRLGSLEALVNNAGTLGPSPLPALEHLAPAALEEVLRVNVVAPLALAQLALPHLRRSGGALVAVTSDAAVEAYEGWGGYGASKAALEQLHHVLAVEAPAVRVYRFDPGDMRTQMHQDAFPGEDISDRADPSVAAASLVRLLSDSPPSGRYRAADFAEVPA